MRRREKRGWFDAYVRELRRRVPDARITEGDPFAGADYAVRMEMDDADA